MEDALPFTIDLASGKLVSDLNVRFYFSGCNYHVLLQLICLVWQDPTTEWASHVYEVQASPEAHFTVAEPSIIATLPPAVVHFSVNGKAQTAQSNALNITCSLQVPHGKVYDFSWSIFLFFKYLFRIVTFFSRSLSVLVAAVTLVLPSLGAYLLINYFHSLSVKKRA